MKNVIKPLAKSVLIPLGLTTAASAADAGIHKKILGSGTTTLIISDKEVNDIIKIVQALEDSNILLKGVTKAIKNETKEQKGELLGTLGASLLGHLLTGKRIARAGTGKGIVRAGTSRPSSSTSYNHSLNKKRMGFLIPPQPLTNFEIQKYYENEPRFNGVFSRNNWP